jgi:hypothetical protein
VNFTKRRKVETTADGAALIAGACLGMLAVIPFEAWLLMLVLGAIHGIVVAVPAVGFGTAVLLVIGLNMVIGYARKLFRK